MKSRRYLPNLLISGTPGTGKSSTCELLKRELEDYKYINISDFAKEFNCYDGFDKGRKSHIVDEDKLLDELEPILREGHNIVDWHVNDVFPERLIDLVVILRADNSVLYDRLQNRKYHDAKVQENLDAEIMGVVLQDAIDSYAQEIVIELQSNNTEEMTSNVDRIVSWVELWKKQHADGVTNELGEIKKDQSESEDESESEGESQSDNEE
ncbi:hypothetical protein TBLA_0E00520 [Henningerozyma blattae CBS 6284]|uniref:Adenylate kinase isoenzyme 6 homolog n=1 Tax=Henningerozyma blattae (strain ATCC 34711 / CBS 6284 / DSM 70876 / NBRC 10599 / NRRL Y-10934 / UCD 77-7) TaxID=1071380 RepID=I2H411_HENB6|nr:hypothetical protein TBLA_0E00520 [Tetrapisispora blattae CBS 6284]CCH61113.1 hypothetical protein TBLA_0E00520 [Tetrapisispora blattae CBS 6284]